MGMKPRPAAFPELATAVVIGPRESDAIALGGGDLEVIALHDPDEVRYLGFQHAYDTWASANGTTYVCGWRDDPLFCYRDGNWAIVELGLPELHGHSRILRVVGISGSEPAADELFCLAEPYGMGATPTCTLLRRSAGRWSEIPLPPGRAWELAAGRDGDVLLSVGGAGIIRARGATTEVIPPPAGTDGWRAVGVCTTARGDLLACFSAPGASHADAWLLRDGTWTAVASEIPLEGWAIGYIDSVTWAGVTYLATTRGVVRLTDEDTLVHDAALCATRLFSIGDALVSLGFSAGVHAHRINRGEGWTSLAIPEPQTKFGGHGKAVVLPGNRTVPRRRIRMPRLAAQPAQPAFPVVTDYCAQWLESRVFEGRGEALAEPRPCATDVSTHYGTELSPPLQRYLELYGRHDVQLRFGELGIWSPAQFAPPARAPTAADLATHVFYQAPSTIAALTGTLYLGADHGGKVYFVEVGADRSEVFLYDPGLGDLAFLADSLDSFMFLNDLAQQWHDYARTHDVDFEDAMEGDVDRSAPEIQRITEGLASLTGRVDLSQAGDVSSEFDELLPELTGLRPTGHSTSQVLPLFAQARWLVMLLGGVYVDISEAPVRDFAEAIAEADVGPNKVYWLWHLFLFDDPRLAGLVARLRDDPSALVRSVAAWIGDPSGENAEPLVRAREQVRAARGA